MTVVCVIDVLDVFGGVLPLGGRTERRREVHLRHAEHSLDMSPVHADGHDDAVELDVNMANDWALGRAIVFLCNFYRLTVDVAQLVDRRILRKVHVVGLAGAPRINCSHVLRRSGSTSVLRSAVDGMDLANY